MRHVPVSFLFLLNIPIYVYDTVVYLQNQYNFFLLSYTHICTDTHALWISLVSGPVVR